MFLMAISTLSLIQYAVVALVILAVVYIILKIGKGLLKWVFGIIINSILGFIAIFLLNYLFGIAIPFTLPIVIATAIFGLPAVGTITILKLMGMLAAA